MERPDPLHLGDIDGAQPRRPLARTTEYAAFNSNQDIDGAAPNHMRSLGRFRSTRATDPLNPQYKLPSFTCAPPPEPWTQPRDVLWTLNQPKWKPQPRESVEAPVKEKFSTAFLYRREAQTRDIMAHKDITGPQFQTEAPTGRHLDPLMPKYFYDGGLLEDVTIRMPHYGSRYPRQPHEARGLMTRDIATAEVHMGTMYPKELIKTRETNRTSDIEGAKADTKPAWPRVWTMPGKTPDAVPEKETNKVWDIYGAVAGTAGRGAPVYRARKFYENEARMALSAPSMRFRQSAADRAADIAAVAALK
ncbi:hypothetical protein AB1Y20_021822 [Prymnesium parvum]|uniref:Uncharacterized protein n=1 Tax=Prymnesium parvum TaxID=97485 RepID=A0AB34JKH8_PRYPA